LEASASAFPIKSSPTGRFFVSLSERSLTFHPRVSRDTLHEKLKQLDCAFFIHELLKPGLLVWTFEHAVGNEKFLAVLKT
jgi:hypothetical protein